jgi:hypothetical protein
MRRHCLMIAAALASAACAQIAGFEQLSSKKPPNDEGAAGSVGGGVSNSNGVPSKGGANGSDAGESAGGGDGEAGGNVNIGNNAGFAAGGVGPGGSGSAAGGAAAAGGSAAGGGGAVVGGCNAEQLKNGSFDAGPVDWTQESTAPGILGVDDVILDQANSRLTLVQVTPKSGNYLAWLGGRPNSDKSTRVNLLQSVQIPAKVSNLVVSGWIRMRTTEPVAVEANDQLDLALQDDDDFWSFHVWRVGDLPDEWQAFEFEADNPAVLDAVRGRTLTFIAESKTDTSYETHFWLDSLSFVAECP